MCEKQKRIDELEVALHESHMREANLFKALAEARKFESEKSNFDSQIALRPWQVALVPIIIAVLGGLTSVAIAITKIS